MIEHTRPRIKATRDRMTSIAGSLGSVTDTDISRRNLDYTVAEKTKISAKPLYHDGERRGTLYLYEFPALHFGDIPELFMGATHENAPENTNALLGDLAPMSAHASGKPYRDEFARDFKQIYHMHKEHGGVMGDGFTQTLPRLDAWVRDALVTNRLRGLKVADTESFPLYLYEHIKTLPNAKGYLWDYVVHQNQLAFVTHCGATPEEIQQAQAYEDQAKARTENANQIARVGSRGKEDPATKSFFFTYALLDKYYTHRPAEEKQQKLDSWIAKLAIEDRQALISVTNLILLQMSRGDGQPIRIVDPQRPDAALGTSLWHFWSNLPENYQPLQNNTITIPFVKGVMNIGDFGVPETLVAQVHPERDEHTPYYQLDSVKFGDEEVLQRHPVLAVVERPDGTTHVLSPQTTLQLLPKKAQGVADPEAGIALIAAVSPTMRENTPDMLSLHPGDPKQTRQQKIGGAQIPALMDTKWYRERIFQPDPDNKLHATFHRFKELHPEIYRKSRRGRYKKHTA